MNGRSGNSHLRRQIAFEAVRLLMDGNAGNHDIALRKAASRLGVQNKRLWPSAAEVEEALNQELRLFRGQQHQDELSLLRNRALQAMGAFDRFKPRLVGSVLEGSADRDSTITLHLFSDTAEEVMLTLLEQGIPWQERERTLRYPRGERRVAPVFSFIAGDIPIELIVLRQRELRSPPLNPVTEKPERGIDIGKLEGLLAGDLADTPG